ncbi:exosome nuclease subunit [Basidiobolus ranarum]|uniref:Exosome nuclease subunit n=1 Tax=Basidiobolus ranarum TaxID=34480 RepID=A0ABR2WN56_9FUNG
MKGDEIPFTNVTDDFEAFSNSFFDTLLSATRAASILPTDLSFHKSLDLDLATTIAGCSSKVLRISNELLKHVGGDITDTYYDADDVQDRYDGVIDVLDNLLEKADVCLDECTGKTSTSFSAATFQSPVSVTKLATEDKSEYHLIHAQNILRPQLKFKDVVDNSANTPWIRKIKEKPNALVPLDYGLPNSLTQDRVNDALTNHVRNIGYGDITTSLPHPYEYELGHQPYPLHVLEAKREQLYLPFEETNATWVDTKEGLQRMMEKLEGLQEIAVDLEHHSYRTYQGILCLMQLSTRDEDFIIDTIELRNSLYILNKIFTDPKVIKVLHGAEMDIQWLQRDLGLYVVHLFDTFHASKVLEFPSHSLAFLLKHYADIHADKKYQLADWRIRPLPTEMLKYARTDTHYLLYIYDRMRNELINKSNPATLNLLLATLDRSKETALRTYEKELYNPVTGEGPGGWRNLYNKWNRAMDYRQLAVFKTLHAWRDQTARDEDESTRYILPNHMLFVLSERMPTDTPGVLGCCSPIPPIVRLFASDLAFLILRTKSDAEARISKSKFKEIQLIRPHSDTTHDVTNIVESRSQAKPKNKTVKASSTRPKIDVPPLNLVDAAPYLANVSSLFEEMTGLELEIERNNRKLAEKIHSSLVLTVEMSQINDEEVLEPPGVHIYVKPKKMKKELEVLVISDLSKKRGHESVDEFEQDEGSVVLKEDDNLVLIPNETDTMDVPTDIIKKPTGGKKKKRKRPNKKSKSVTQIHDTSTQKQGEFKAFDYDGVEPKVDEVNPSKFHQVLNDGKQRGTPRFDPYNNIENDKKFKKKGPKTHTRPNTGNRSMAVGKSKK